jgi:hypothetical protein
MRVKRSDAGCFHARTADCNFEAGRTKCLARAAAERGPSSYATSLFAGYAVSIKTSIPHEPEDRLGCQAPSHDLSAPGCQQSSFCGPSELPTACLGPVEQPTSAVEDICCDSGPGCSRKPSNALFMSTLHAKQEDEVGGHGREALSRAHRKGGTGVCAPMLVLLHQSANGRGCGRELLGWPTHTEPRIAHIHSTYTMMPTTTGRRSGGGMSPAIQQAAAAAPVPRPPEGPPSPGPANDRGSSSGGGRRRRA